VSDPRCQKQEQESGGEQGDDLDLAAYALGALDPEACAPLEARLRAGADQGLSWRLAEYRAVTALLPHAAAPQALPPGAWCAVLSRVREDRRARGAPTWRTPFAPFGRLAGWRPVWARRRPGGSWWVDLGGHLQPARWPLAATAVAALLLWNVTLQRQLLDLPSAAGVPGAGGGSAVGAQQLARLPDGPVVHLEGTGRPGASARLFVDRQGSWAWLAVAGLRPLPRERVYQLWFARPGEPTVSGSTFRVDAEGGAVTPVWLPAALGTVSAIAVTEEAAPASLRPTGPHLLDGRP
jgi:anti-sigma-K factor RskA